MSATLENLHQLRADLAELDAAIRAASDGSSYSIGNRTLTRQNLGELDQQRTRLVRRIAETERVLQGARFPMASVANFTDG